MNDSVPADTDGGALRIGVLGPLEVRAQGEDRTPTAPMARRALAVLLLSANRLVSTSALIGELWESDPPRLARKTVQTYVYQIRKALKCPADPSDRVRTGPGGYRIDLRPGELDLWEFEHGVMRARTALSEGDPRASAHLLRQALGLWRGEPFAGLDAGPLLAAQIAQIADSRLGALELRITADLQLGRHRAVVGELHQLIADHPFHEEFAAQLMLAAHRSGQRATALEAFARLRRRLVDELGIEPSERLQRLQQDVLNETLPQPAAAVTGPGPLPAQDAAGAPPLAVPPRRRRRRCPSAGGCRWTPRTSPDASRNWRSSPRSPARTRVPGTRPAGSGPGGPGWWWCWARPVWARVPSPCAPHTVWPTGSPTVRSTPGCTTARTAPDGRTPSCMPCCGTAEWIRPRCPTTPTTWRACSGPSVPSGRSWSCWTTRPAPTRCSRCCRRTGAAWRW
ncbi:winged helix-turn-helix domain-containing protein [Streptomyces europaeiscabiei]|uniref:AfsR/SARP family transcriptional regulator n=1 Tax=Streptomyces europaeiscabiei TaxID=146819 RepID=UPI002E19D330